MTPNIDAAAATENTDSWKRIRQYLKTNFGDEVFTSWFERIELESIVEETVRLSVPTRFLKSWLTDHYEDRILRAFKLEHPDVKRIVFEVRLNRKKHVTSDLPATGTLPALEEDINPGIKANPERSLSSQLTHNPPAEKFESTSINRLLTFDTYIPGTAGTPAYDAARHIVRKTDPDHPAPSSLYIYARTGLGKTHILHAIANQAEGDGLRSVYLSADQFIYKFVPSLNAENARSRRKALSDIDILIIDDIQLIDESSSRQELARIISDMIESGSRVVVAADRHPSKIDHSCTSASAYLTGGTVAEITAPDQDHRERILSARIKAVQAMHPSFHVPDDIKTYVAQAITTNARDLEGAVTRLLAHSTLTGTLPTIESAKDAIRDLMQTTTSRRVKIEDIQKLVAIRYNVTRDDILSERRSASIVAPRQIAMYLSRTLTFRSMPEIGRLFGGRDHTTVLHAVRKIDRLIRKDNTLKHEIDHLSNLLMK